MISKNLISMTITYFILKLFLIFVMNFFIFNKTAFLGNCISILLNVNKKISSLKFEIKYCLLIGNIFKLNYKIKLILHSLCTSKLYYFYILCIFILSLLFNINHIDYVFASSPSISLQEVRSSPFNWIDMYKNKTGTFSGLPYVDIVSINYFSVDHILDATLWLSAPFKSNFSSTYDGKINYGMFVDADANNKTGLGGIDYQIEISGENGRWNKTLWQLTSIPNWNRTVEKQINLKDFFGKEGDKYIHFNLNLDNIGSPDKYRILFYAEQIKKDIEWKVDFTNWIYVPKPNFNISISPNFVELIQGDNKTIEIKLESDTGFTPIIDISADVKAQNVNLVYLFFNSSNNYIRNTIPPFGTIIFPLTIRAIDNAILGQHDFQITANATFPESPLIKPTTESKMQSISSFIKSETIPKKSTLTVIIQPKPTLIDIILEISQKWEFPITFATGIFTGYVIPWILKKLRNKNKKDPRENFDY